MYQINNAYPQDLEEVFSFQVQCDIAEFGEQDSSRDDLEELWSEIDPARDAFLVRKDSGGLVGYGCVSGAHSGLQVDIYIDPHSSPEGVEDELMRACVARAGRRFSIEKTHQEVHLTGYARVTNPRSVSLFKRWGFNEQKRHYNMAVELPGNYPVPQWPTGYKLSAFAPGEEHELYEFIEKAFSRPDREPSTFEFWRNLLLRGGRYEPELFLMVREGERIVGAALSYAEEAGGWVRQLGVAANQRGKGLGSLMLQQLFHQFSRRGVKRVALAVSGENANALRVYERAGMHRSREYIEFLLTIS